MRTFRFSISSLLGVISFISVALAALRASTDAWDSGVLALAVMILLMAILLAVHCTDRRRAYWLGFGLFGWTYLVASLIPPVDARLPTTKGLILIDSKLPGRETTISAVFGYTSVAGRNPVQVVGYTPQNYTLPTSVQGNVWIDDATTGNLPAGTGGTTENFIRIGHSLLALVLAFIGGHLSRNLHDIGRQREDGVRSPSDSSTFR